jgi:hypothetical protein
MQQVQNDAYLTLYIYENLKWTIHISKVVANAGQVGGFFQVLRFLLPIKLTTTI